MLKSKILIIYSIILTLALCIYLNGYSIAGDCDEPGRGGDTPTAPGTPTVSGDHNYSENWNPGLQFDPSNPDEIDRNHTITIKIIGGCPPYTWSVNGNGFTLDYTTTTGLTNTLYADDTACGAATLSVIGCDGGTPVTGYVRSTTGQWVNKGNYIGLSGSYDSGTLATGYWKKLGNKFQYHKVHTFYTWGDDCEGIDLPGWCDIYGFDSTMGLIYPRPSSYTCYGGTTVWIMDDPIDFAPCFGWTPVIRCPDYFPPDDELEHGCFFYVTMEATYYEWECP